MNQDCSHINNIKVFFSKQMFFLSKKNWHGDMSIMLSLWYRIICANSHSHMNFSFFLWNSVRCYTSKNYSFFSIVWFSCFRCSIVSTTVHLKPKAVWILRTLCSFRLFCSNKSMMDNNFWKNKTNINKNNNVIFDSHI